MSSWEGIPTVLPGLGIHGLMGNVGLHSRLREKLFDSGDAWLKLHPTLSKRLWYLFCVVSAGGSILFGIKPFFQKLCSYLPTTYLESDDELYKCVQKHVFSKSSNTQFNVLEARSSGYEIRLQARHEQHRWDDGDDDDEPASTSGVPDNSSELLFYKPGSRYFLYEGTWFLMDVPSHSRRGLPISLRPFWFNNNPTRKLLKDAWNTHKYEAAESKLTSIFRYSSGSHWRLWKSRPARPLNTIDLDDDDKKKLIDDIAKYLEPKRKVWYESRGIPLRRGYLFQGPPGTGKSSLAAALAGYFSTSLYTLSLSDSDLSDYILGSLLNALPRKSILLLEDIDSAGIKREDGARHSGPRSKVTLSGLLNALDGPLAPEGHILIMSTNTPEKLDPALVRTGRVDCHVHFPDANRNIAMKVFNRMFAAHGVSERDLEGRAEAFASQIPENEFSPAELQGYLLEHAENINEAIENVDEWIAKMYKRREDVKTEEERRKHGKAKSRPGSRPDHTKTKGQEDIKAMVVTEGVAGVELQ